MILSDRQVMTWSEVYCHLRRISIWLAGIIWISGK